MHPYKISIPDDELDLLKQKLRLARLPKTRKGADQGEDNGVTASFMQDILNFWRTQYDWRSEEARLNTMAQFMTNIDVEGFGDIELHFVHARSQRPDAIPLLFLHGWPGSFMEVSNILPILNEAGFHVVAPSLPGYGFSSYPEKPGFKHRHHAMTFHSLMQKLDYPEYVVQGGDWGSDIVRIIGLMYPENVKAVHQNMLMMLKPDFPGGQEPTYSAYERICLDRLQWFNDTNSDYDKIQATKPRTLGFAMHDSPVGMLAWMADKLFMWADEYPWTHTELITWTLLHYFPGPTTAFQMYFENNPAGLMDPESWVRTTYLKAPTGYSAFPKELSIVPRSWAETISNVQSWKEHSRGGHFAAYEKPNELAEDVIDFFHSVWKSRK
ncbi:hypothetical protein LTR13_002126 [Exophiala sideris]|nr:hypothetical protein LTR13_002126 [Exophiala sideris]KAK5185587.1 glycosylphosphatidylinositol anchor biosynthesis [Eurotiomycetes sp. CCFEE 6388]